MLNWNERIYNYRLLEVTTKQPRLQFLQKGNFWKGVIGNQVKRDSWILKVILF